MDKFKIDLMELKKVMNPDLNRVPVKGNEHRIVRMAFDFFKFKDGDPDELWHLESCNDGEFLVRTYSLSDNEKQLEASDWNALLDKKEANVTVYYKNLPITRLAGAEYGAETPEDARMFRDMIFSKFNADKGFVKNFIRGLPSEKQQALSLGGYFSDLDIGMKEMDSEDEWEGGGGIDYNTTTIEEALKRTPVLQEDIDILLEKGFDEEDIKKMTLREFWNVKLEATKMTPEEEKEYNKLEYEYLYGDNDAVDPVLAALELELNLTKKAKESLSTSVHEKFDLSDVKKSLEDEDVIELSPEDITFLEPDDEDFIESTEESDEEAIPFLPDEDVKEI